MDKFRPHVIGCLFSLIASTGAVTAQTLPSLPPLPEGVGTPLTPRMESCDSIDCDVSPAQIKAFDTARNLYSKDKAASASYSAVVGQEGHDITITLIPSPVGSGGKGITYVFDATGVTLRKSYLNR